MHISRVKIQYPFYIALIVSTLLVFQQYTDYLINGYDFDFSWFAVSAKILINYLLWAGMFIILLRVGDRIIGRPTSALSVVIHLLLSFGISIVHRVASVRLYDVVYFAKSGFLRDWLTPNNQVQLGAGIFSSFLQYWIIMAIIMALTYYSKYLEKQKELSDARLNALQMQLQPHFLFNTLNSIASLIDLDSKKAQKMLSQLGFLMREMLEHDNKQYILLAEELEYIKTYLAIEQIRFQDVMTLTYHLDANLDSARVPALILQPVVENAVKHGISKCPNGGELTIRSAVVNSELQLTVSNDFCQINETKKEGYGIGVTNVRKRLEQLYSEDFVYENSIEQHKFISQITIPLDYHD